VVKNWKEIFSVMQKKIQVEKKSQGRKNMGGIKKLLVEIKL